MSSLSFTAAKRSDFVFKTCLLLVTCNSRNMLFGSFNFKKCTSSSDQNFVKVLFFILLQKLEGTSVELEHFERDIFSLRQELTSASGGGNRHNNGSASGGSNRHTAGLESELRQIQDRAGQLQRSRAELVRNIHYLRGTYMETLFMHS